MNGTFQISMATPLGLKQGTLEFREENGELEGTLRALGSTNRIEGKVTGNFFEFSGTLKIGFGRFDFTARGTVDGDTLTATAFTSYGKFPITGFRV